MSGRSLPIYASSSENKKAIPTDPASPPGLSKAVHHTTPPNAGSLTLTCPVPDCSSVFKGEWAHGYLWRHLRHPKIHKRTGEEKAAWLHLHKIEHDRVLATRATPTQRRRETNEAKAQKVLRTSRFELRARSMGITENALVAQKVAIWEGLWTAEQKGDRDSDEVRFFIPLNFRGYFGIFAD